MSKVNVGIVHNPNVQHPVHLHLCKEGDDTSDRRIVFAEAFYHGRHLPPGTEVTLYVTTDESVGMVAAAEGYKAAGHTMHVMVLSSPGTYVEFVFRGAF